jgi:hypothetical protein
MLFIGPESVPSYKEKLNKKIQSMNIKGIT